MQGGRSFSGLCSNARRVHPSRSRTWLSARYRLPPGSPESLAAPGEAWGQRFVIADSIERPLTVAPKWRESVRRAGF